MKNTIGKDKLQHNRVGFRITIIIFLSLFLILFLASLFGIMQIDSLLFSDVYTIFAMAILIIGREIYDKYKPNPTGFDKQDIKFGVGGAIFGLLLANLVAFAIIWLVGMFL